jgi:phosphate-selective porin
MSDAAEMTERRGRILAELSERGLSLARALHARALAAETTEEACELGLAFHRISRSLRQTLALEARLERDDRRQDHEDRVEAQRQDQARVLRRRTQVRIAMERAIWNEAEGDEAERLLDDLDDVLEGEVLADGFADAPLDAHIARLCAEFGLAAPGPDEADEDNAIAFDSADPPPKPWRLSGEAAVAVFATPLPPNST